MFSNQSIVIIKGHNLPKNYHIQILVLHMDGEFNKLYRVSQHINFFEDYFITRDDVVSQRLKFGSAFLSSSWESKIALFF